MEVEPEKANLIQINSSIVKQVKSAAATPGFEINIMNTKSPNEKND